MLNVDWLGHCDFGDLEISDVSALLLGSFSGNNIYIFPEDVLDKSVETSNVSKSINARHNIPNHSTRNDGRESLIFFVMYFYSLTFFIHVL